MSDLDEVVKLLHSKTFDRKLKWQLLDERFISTRQGNNTIDLRQDNFSGFNVTLRNVDGIVLAQQYFPPDVPMGEMTTELFTRARRDALGVDEAISEVKNRLLQL